MFETFCKQKVQQQNKAHSNKISLCKGSKGERISGISVLPYRTHVSRYAHETYEQHQIVHTSNEMRIKLLNHPGSSLRRGVGESNDVMKYMKCIVYEKEIKEMNFGNRAKVMCHICAVLEMRELP